MIHSYISRTHFDKINLLLDQFCQRCSQVNAVCKVGCELSHRKNKVVIPFKTSPETEQSMLEAI